MRSFEVAQVPKTRFARAVGSAFGAAIGAAVLAGAVQTVHAQAATTLDRVEVTGSRIKRVDSETAAPVTVLTREDIEKTGATTVADVIRSLSVDNNGTITNAFGGGFAAGGSAVSLRGLGVNSTLVLLNGRRLAPYGLADDGQRNFTDLSSMPLDAIDRIEVLKDGASAIYGADAVGGVINVILRRAYNGVSAGVSGGMTKYRDGENVRTTLTAGFGDLAADKFNVFGNLEYQKQNPIFERDRRDRGLMFNQDMTLAGYDYLNFAQFGILIPGLAISGGPAGAVRDVTGGTNYRFLPCPPGARAPSPSALAQYPGLNNNFSSQNGGPANCIFEAFDYFMVKPKEERLNLFVKGTLALSSDWEAFVEASQFNTRVYNYGTPSSVSSAWPDIANNRTISNATITIADNHPDNPFAADGLPNRLRYITAEFGGRDQSQDNSATRLLAGVRGAAAGWDMEAGLLWSQSESDIVRTGYLRNSVLRDFLNGTNLTGQNPTLTFYRLGVNAGLNSAATRNAISPRLNNHTETSITSVDVKGSRELMQIGGGPLAIALGAEWREEKLDSPATPFTDTADIIGLGFAAFAGDRTVTAAFGELVAPITRTLEASLAVRHDRYSDFGNSTTPKLGLKWTPDRRLLIRGSYAEAFRAPGAAENGNSSSAGFTSYRDPLLCPITGSPLDCSGTAVLINTGNPAIEPETAKSYTLGFVLEPTTTTDVSLDFWKVERKNEISPADIALILSDPSNIPGSTFVRQDDGRGPLGPNGEFALSSVSAPYFNAGLTETSGFDVDLRQRLGLGNYGKLAGSLVWTHLNRFTKTLRNGNRIEYAGSHGPTSLSGNGGMPRDRITLSLTWDLAAWSNTLRLNHVGATANKETTNDTLCLNTFADGSDAPSGCRIGSFRTLDWFIKWSGVKNLEVFGSVKNLLDVNPPYDPQVYSAFHYNPIYHLAGAVGREYNVGIKYTFR